MKAPLFWDKPNSLTAHFLQPLAFFYRCIVGLRALLYKRQVLRCYRAPWPVIVIGNITVGGTGKTPLLVWLTLQLKQAGFKPAVVTRGYGANSTSKQPLWVTSESDPNQVGDEPVLIAKKTQCPVVVSPKRSQAVKRLTEQNICNIVVCDDGLQHYALERDLEICVIDGLRRFGNQHLLPAGPLRESVTRLLSVDYLVTNTTAGGSEQCGEWPMYYQPQSLRYVHNDQSVQQRISTACALAGIGYPPRFFTLLERMGICLTVCKAYPDHYRYRREILLRDFGASAVVMTEKDAVKCRAFAQPNWYYLPVEAQLPAEFSQKLLTHIKKVSHGIGS